MSLDRTDRISPSFYSQKGMTSTDSSDIPRSTSASVSITFRVSKSFEAILQILRVSLQLFVMWLLVITGVLKFITWLHSLMLKCLLSSLSILQTLTQSEPSVGSNQFASVDIHLTDSDSTKLEHPKCLAKLLKFHSEKPRHFTLEVPMGALRFLDTGLQKITESLMGCTPVPAFFSTTSPSVAERSL